jgi:hypothetical protein
VSGGEGQASFALLYMRIHAAHHNCTSVLIELHCSFHAYHLPCSPRYPSPRYRSVLERLLGARLVYAAPDAQRAISFEYLNRQLVWTEMSELLLFLLPLVDVAALKRALRASLPRLPSLMATGHQQQGEWQVDAQLEAWGMQRRRGVVSSNHPPALLFIRYQQ